VGLRAVEATPPEHGAGLDQQDGLVGAVQEVGTQLVGEQPAARGRGGSQHASA
jgi:hypothetical protein